MQGFGAQTHLFSEVHRAPTIWANKKEVSNGPQKVTDPIFVNPPPEGLLNNANKLERKELGPKRLGGVRINPSFFWIRAVFPWKTREIQFWTFARLKTSKSLWPKFFRL